ncbi:TPR-like protein [Hanseniaspora valbyensis NRRL Y-1626]|uniref:TPR-like protein n=1 Tax=Hanseniaspora valbyensis NRRL Y-1626 TaxID=766949 RepID=A0A1B7THL8_9ASCO|nr:TPR-like protein [Hanseniaspora valbyensis NRRL Y-1626]
MSTSPEKLIQQAQEKSKPVTGFFWKIISSPEDQYEEAIDLYIQAAKIYRLGSGSSKQDYSKAAFCYIQAADVCLDLLQNFNEAAVNFIEGYKLYKMDQEFSSAIEALKKGIECFTVKMGQFRRAANYQFELGEVLELQLQDYKEAAKVYKMAGDWYLQDNALQLSNKCYLKYADLLSLQSKGNQDLFDAIKTYQTLIENNLAKNTNTWSLKDYYLKIGLLQLLLTDNVAAERTLNEAKQKLSDDKDCKEFQLLAKLIECYQEQDLDLMSQTLMQFDKFQKLDNWKTTILLKIKESMIGNDEDDLL